MDQSRPYRPRVSRETRLLLITALLAIAALWVLARIRFPDRPAAPNPVQPLLTQLAPRPSFDDLASEIADLYPRLDPLLLAVQLDPPGPPELDAKGEAGPSVPRTADAAGDRARPALRVRDDVAVVLLEAGAGRRTAEYGTTLIARDPGSGLAVVRVPGVPTPRPVLWSSGQMQRPRYVIATDTSSGAVSLYPVFVASMHPMASARWPGQLWRVPAQSDLVSGAFVFTQDAMFAGLVVGQGGGRALVPAENVLAEAERLLARSGKIPGQLGIEVQALTPPIARATGAATGVVVTWVDAGGPAAGILETGQVIETADGALVPTEEHWDALTGRLAAGQAITLGVRAGGERRDVPLVATVPPAPPDRPSLGLTLRTVAGTGAEVLGVDRGSVADKAGLVTGDVMTRIADIRAPTPGQVRQRFNASLDGQPVLVAFTRGGTHHVRALEK